MRLMNKHKIIIVLTSRISMIKKSVIYFQYLRFTYKNHFP